MNQVADSDANLPARLRMDEVQAGGRIHPNDTNKTIFIHIFCAGVGGGGGAEIVVERDIADPADGCGGGLIGSGGVESFDWE